jgi:hypothetical protein
MMEGLVERGLSQKVFLWSDDNLSNDFMWRFLSEQQLQLISSFRKYSRVCCFKGLNAELFSLNTKADPALFLNQFRLCKRLLDLGIDLYCYVILTGPTKTSFHRAVSEFLDAAQRLHELLPLRMVPLRVSAFTPVRARMNSSHQDLLDGQMVAIRVWEEELNRRFSTSQIQLPITEITLR